MKRQTLKFNKQKAKALVKFIICYCENLNYEKLVQMIYFIEFDFFEKYEEGLCGFTFIKGKNTIYIKELDKLLEEIKNKKEFKK